MLLTTDCSPSTASCRLSSSLPMLLFDRPKSSQKALATIKLALYCCPELLSRPVFRDNIGLKQKLSQHRRLPANSFRNFFQSSILILSVLTANCLLPAAYCFLPTDYRSLISDLYLLSFVIFLSLTLPSLPEPASDPLLSGPPLQTGDPIPGIC